MNTSWITCPDCVEHDDGLVLCDQHRTTTDYNQAEETLGQIATINQAETAAREAITNLLRAHGVSEYVSVEMGYQTIDTYLADVITENLVAQEATTNTGATQ